MTEQRGTGPSVRRIRQAARRYLSRRPVILAGLWAGLPLLTVLFVHGTGASGALVVYTMGIVAWWTARCSGSSWKNPERVKALIAEGGKVLAVLPVRHPRIPVARRLFHGCFVVLTERQVLVFAYSRLRDVPTELMWAADRHEDAVALRDGRTLVLPTPGASTELALPRRLRPTTTTRLAALLRRPPPARQPPPPWRGRGSY
ncbi:hypothetical protein ABS735_01795 [Streptomyces sp. MMCC 100]|uniref:hypothetical protein n=1 Tax=Streptomyces sp. MMCC 100 TaxID=3163555 RepID=UPI003596264E